MLLNNENNFLHLAKKIIKIIMKKIILIFVLVFIFDIACAKNKNEWTEPITGMQFVKVKKGCFLMGSVGWDTDESPIHKVCVDSFWIGKYEVTQGQWKKIIKTNPSRWKISDKHPLENASFHDILEFIKRLNKASKNKFVLPTEAQWEYAAKGRTKSFKYSGSNNPDKVAWYWDNSNRKTHKVGTKAPNGLGIYDMSGNVWEWCQDTYDKKAYSKHKLYNPIIKLSSVLQSVRGGGWFNSPAGLRITNRIGSAPDVLDSLLGFRLCVIKDKKIAD